MINYISFDQFDLKPPPPSHSVGEVMMLVVTIAVLNISPDIMYCRRTRTITISVSNVSNYTTAPPPPTPGENIHSTRQKSWLDVMQDLWKS